jgi:glycosyltransferase involved in cell wall biosynthesis
MKIGFFCNEYPPRPHGGIGTFVHMLAQALLIEGHVITVAQWGKQARTDWLEGVRVVTLQESATPHLAWLLNRLRLWRWLRAEARAGRIEVFEIPEYQGCLPFPLRACPVAVRLHLAESHIRSIMGGARGKAYWLEKATLYWHRNWIGVSRYILDETRRFFALEPRRGTVIHNPAPLIDANKLPVLEARPAKYVVYVGSVSERKGALLLAEAMREVFAADSGVHLVYVGPETEYRGLPISAAILRILAGYEKRVVLVGRVPHEQALAWVRYATILVLDSKVEAFPIVVLEAMAVNTPVICAKCGPGPELVDNDVNGILVNSDSKNDLVVALNSLLDNPRLREQFGALAKRKVEERFSISLCVESSLEYYKVLKSTKDIEVFKGEDYE